MAVAAAVNEDHEILAAGFSAVFGTHIVSEARYHQMRALGMAPHELPQGLTMDHIFKSSYMIAPVGIQDDYTGEVYVKTLTGNVSKVPVHEHSTSRDIKFEAALQLNTQPDEIRLIYNGSTFEDHQKLSDVGASFHSTFYLVIKLRGSNGGDKIISHYLDPKLLDPDFNYDFTHQSDDEKTYMRGPYPYKRPYGWKRYALKVVGKYKDDVWLGAQGIRTDTTEGEWSVSFHGTAVDNANSMSQYGYLKSKCKRHAFGTGVYSSPDIAVAVGFGTQFTFDGSQYYLLFQNRVNPDPSQLSIVKPEETGNVGDYWVSKFDDSHDRVDNIRPYNILIKKF